MHDYLCSTDLNEANSDDADISSSLDVSLGSDKVLLEEGRWLQPRRQHPEQHCTPPSADQSV